MRIWVDADACPNAIKQILFRAAERTKIHLTLVANRLQRTPRSPYLHAVRVPAGFDEADHRIVQLMEPGDLVVTADIPLAAAVIERQAHALSPRGERFTPDNIRERLNLRDFMDTMRSSGFTGGGPAPLSASDRQAFANGLDSYLASHSQNFGSE